MDKALRLAAVLTICTMLGGCAWLSTLFGGSTATGSLCPIGPFIGDPGASSRLTRAEKEYVVTLNKSGAAICGWTPPRK